MHITSLFPLYEQYNGTRICCTVYGIFAARVLFLLCGLCYSSPAYYIASSTIFGAPVKRGVVPSSITAHMSQRIGCVGPD
jgi:hypothetical protein